MAGNKLKYLELWQRYLPQIIQVLQNYDNKIHHLLLNSYEFRLVGNMKNYSFNLEFSDGKVSNNIRASAIARDLATVIESSPEASQIISAGHYKFRMDKTFSLCIWKQEYSLLLPFAD